MCETESKYYAHGCCNKRKLTPNLNLWLIHIFFFIVLANSGRNLINYCWLIDCLESLSFYTLVPTFDLISNVLKEGRFKACYLSISLSQSHVQYTVVFF